MSVEIRFGRAGQMAPAWTAGLLAAALLSPVRARLGAELDGIPSRACATVNLVWSREAVASAAAT